MRGLLLLMLFGGCDYILGLTYHAPPLPGESRTNDEDGDDIADAFDLCPHLDIPAEKDSDDDGIGDACDPRPDEPDARYFFPLLGGDYKDLVPTGIVVADGDSLIVGNTGVVQSGLVFNTETDRADISIAATILEYTTDIGTPNFSELGLFAVHRTFQDPQRGDNCLVGRDDKTPPNYFELNADDKDLPGGTRFDGDVIDATMFLRRTPAEFWCSLATPSSGVRSEPQPTRATTGKIAIGAEQIRVQIDSIWIVTPRL